MGKVRLVKRRHGAAAVGYGLLVGLIALAIIAAVAITGENLAQLFGLTANRIETGDHRDPAPPTPPGEPQQPGAPALGLSTAALDFSIAATAIPSFADAQQLSVTNSGTGPASGLSLSLSDPEAFSAAWVDSACASALPAGESCVLTVGATASANMQNRTATLQVPGAGSVTLTLNATGFDPQLVLPGAETALAVAAVADGLPPGACTPLPVANPGLGTLQGLALEPLTGTDAAAFAACAEVDSVCVDSLPAGESCNFGIQLVASAAGDFTAMASVTATGVGAVTRALSGTAGGFAPLLELPGAPAALAVADIADGAAQGDCTALPVRNAGTAPMLGIALGAFTGTNAGNFTACSDVDTPCDAGGLAPGSTCALGVRLVASAAGDFTATANVTATDTAPATRDVTGSAAGYAPVLEANNGSTAFTVTAIDNGAASGACTPLTVRNGGTAPLDSIALGSFGGSDASNFEACSTGAAPCGSGALAPGASCTLGLRLLASAPGGSYSASVSVTGSDVAPVALSLSGSASGYAPALTVQNATEALTVTAITGGAPTGACTALPITNSGSAPLASPAVAGFGGTHPERFQACTVSGGCGSSLAAGASCNLGVQLVSSFAGSFEATVRVSGQGVAERTRPIAGSASGYVPVLALAEGEGSVTLAAISGGATGQGACTDILVENTGTATATALTFGGFSGGNSGSFSGCAPSENLCGTSLAAGAQCRYGARLQVSSNGTYTSTLTVTAAGGVTGTVDVEGTASGIARASCAATHDAGEGSSDGMYAIDPDGIGGNEPYAVYCDMQNGGWMLVGKISTDGRRLPGYAQPGDDVYTAAEATDEPVTWFSSQTRPAGILTAADERGAGPASLGIASILPVLNANSVARITVIAEGNTSHRATWYKTVTAANLSTWFRGSEPDPSWVCRGDSGSCAPQGQIASQWTFDSGYFNFTGMHIVPDTGALHMRLNGDQAAHFNGVCSFMAGRDAEWPDNGGDSHWGNGLQIWIK